jgi:predicted AAA+ superfamily ATPase
VPSLVEIDPMVLEKIFNDPTLFLLFCDYLPFEKDLSL